MKTLVLFIALAGIASAAPASPQANGFKIIASRSPSFIRRQKKSPQQQESFIPQSPESVSQFETLPEDFSADINGPTASARSHFGFKGPIVVKKKSGYHVYRNSEEERAAADPHENCGKQMRVKLCNSHVNRRSNDMIAATNDQNIRNPKDDVESSIQVAKEAIQSLEKNMQKMEENGQWKHGQSDLDTNMHQNIEAVRQALQNVQGRIGKKESMNSQATTLKDTKLDHVSQGKSEEERLAQWKGTKQKNVEVASNIEDRFKSADNLLLSSAIDTTKMMRSNGQEHKNHQVPTASRLTISKHAADETDKIFKLDQHKTLEKRTSEKNDMDVTAAASEHIKTTAQHIPSAPRGKSNDLSLDVQGIKPNAKAEWKKDRSTETHLSLSSANHVHEHENTKSKTETTSRNSENKFQGSHTMHNIHKVNTAEHATSKKLWENNSEHLIQGKSTWEETQSENTIMKAAEQTNLAKTTPEINIHSLAEHIDKKVLEKTVEQESELTKKLSQDTEKAASEIVIHTDALKTAKPELQTKSSEFELNVKKGHGMHMVGHDMHKGGHGMFVGGQGMHMAGKEMHGMHMQGHGMHMQGYGTHMQEHGLHMQGQGIHMQGQGLHMQGQGVHLQGQGMHMKEHDVHIGFQAGMKHGKYGKSSDQDVATQESDQMNTLETEKSAKENMLQWKHHDNARSSYGGYAVGGLNLGGASGVHLAGAAGPAVGVFPHGKVGGCAIPLLLSCSPSVVQGSLTKSHSSYAAPAYRENEDMNSKKKRDAVKTSKDLTSSKMKMPTKKNTEILETMN